MIICTKLDYKQSSPFSANSVERVSEKQTIDVSPLHRAAPRRSDLWVRKVQKFSHFHGAQRADIKYFFNDFF